MSDETSQPPQQEQPQSVERCTDPAAVAAAVISTVGALSPVVAWGLGKLDDHNAQKQDQPQVILPPGVEDDS